MSRADAIGAAYLICASLFIIGLKRLSSPATARSGNQIAAVGMAIAIAATLFDEQVVTFEWIILGSLVGGIGGAIGAQRVKMTAMPQMVALFNGFGGGAAALIAFADYHDTVGAPGHVETKIIISILFSAVVGSVSFAGSMIAFGKLQDIVTGNPVTVPGQKAGDRHHLRRDPRRDARSSRQGTRARPCSSPSSSWRSSSACRW